MKRRKINKIVNGNYISQRWLSKRGNVRVCHNIVDGAGESLTKRGERQGRLYISFVDVVVQEYSGGGRVNESRWGGRYLESHSSALL
jgi:hypothetical protein